MKTFQVISAAALSLLLGAPAVSFAQTRDQDRYDGGRVQRDGGDRPGGAGADGGYRGRSSQSGAGDRQRGGASERGGGYAGRGAQGGSNYGGRSEARPEGGAQSQYRRGGSRGSEAPQSGGRGAYDRQDSSPSYSGRGSYDRSRTQGRDYERQSRGRFDGDSNSRVPQERGSYDRGGYDRGSYGRGGYDRGGYDRGGYDRGGYDRQRPESRDYSRRSDNRDFGRYSREGLSGRGQLDRNSWSRYRARSFASEHRNWRQRGGYRGYRIPDVYFSRCFGRSHWFRPGQLQFISYGGVPCFEYDDYRFSMLDPYPEYWGDDWYDTDDCYVDYADDGYYLYNRRYPDSPGVAINVSLRF